MQREATVRLPTEANIPTPKIQKSKPNAPPALPVAMEKRAGIGWPAGSDKIVVKSSGNTKLMGITNRNPVMEAAMTEPTIALGTAFSGSLTSSAK